MDEIAVQEETKLATREKILKFEAVIAQLPGAMFGDALPLKHSFADGQYIREIFIPKDMVLVGKIHRHCHANFLMSGTVVVVTESGGREYIQGPVVMVSPAGTKRAVYTLEDTWWVTVHNTDIQDIDEIEKEVIVESYAMLEAEKEAIKQIEEGV